jgi:hypothetical protein
MEADDAFERAKDPAPQIRGQGTLKTFSCAKVRPPAIWDGSPALDSMETEGSLGFAALRSG